MEPKRIRVGITKAPDGLSQDRIRIHQMRVSSASRLRDLEADYAFYTPALFYAFLYLPEIADLRSPDPFTQFLAEYGKEVVPITLRFAKPVFRDLAVTDRPWNHVLFGMEREHWPHYLRWMGTFTFVHRERRWVARVRFNELQIIDPFYADASTVMLGEGAQRSAVTAFCLDTNRGCYWLDGTDRLQPPASRYTKMVYPDTAAFAQAILAEDSQPYQIANQVLDQQAEQDYLAALQKRSPLKLPPEKQFDQMPVLWQQDVEEFIREYYRRFPR